MQYLCRGKNFPVQKKLIRYADARQNGGLSVRGFRSCSGVFIIPGISPYRHENKARQGTPHHETNAPKIAKYNATDPHAKTTKNAHNCIKTVYFIMVLYGHTLHRFTSSHRGNGQRFTLQTTKHTKKDATPKGYALFIILYLITGIVYTVLTTRILSKLSNRTTPPHLIHLPFFRMPCVLPGYCVASLHILCKNHRSRFLPL